jgi:SAM-dependent methyltransferase
MTRPPDRSAALAQYRRRAGFYDLELALFEPLRRRAIERLALHPGECVLDLACGTGLSLPLLAQRVGRHGRVIGIEQSPEMLERARQRVQAQRLPQVTLQCTPVEEAAIPGPADAALFHFTHDVLRRPEAIANVLRHLKPGARVVASGLKWAAPWAPGVPSPVNLFVWPAAAHSVTSFDGLGRPWSLLQAQLGALEVEPALLDAAYLAWGVRR